MPGEEVPKHIDETVKAISEALGVPSLHIAGIQRNLYTRYVFMVPSEEAMKMFKPTKLGAFVLEIALEELEDEAYRVSITLRLDSPMLGKSMNLYTVAETFRRSEGVEGMCRFVSEVVERVKGINSVCDTIDEIVAVLVSNGYKINHISGVYRLEVGATDSNNRFRVNLDIYKGNVTAWFLIHADRYYYYLTDDDIRSALSKRIGSTKYDILYDRLCHDVIITMDGVQPHDVPLLARAVYDAVMDVATKKVELAERIAPAEAAALYIVMLASRDRDAYDINILDVLERTSGITEGIILDRVRPYFNKVGASIKKIPTNLHQCLATLYRRGRLAVDSDWHLTLENMKIIDVVAKYTGGKSVYLADEDESYDIEVDEQYALIRLFEVVEEHELRTLVKGSKSIPGKLVEAILEYCDYDAVLKYLEVLIGNPTTWSKLTSEAKQALAKRRDVDVIALAKEKGWLWVLNDRHLVAFMTASKCEGNVKCITETVAEEFPNLVGGEYDLVYVGGEPFIMMRNAVLQVRGVLPDKVVVHGTVGTSSIGMIAVGRTVSDATKTILENLVDAVIEFREAVNELRSANAEVNVSEIKTPLFSVPIAVITLPSRTVAIPLQPRFAELVKRHVDEGMHSYSGDEEEVVMV